MANETIMRFQIADYLGIPGDSDTTYALMGAGFNTCLLYTSDAADD